MHLLNNLLVLEKGIPGAFIINSLTGTVDYSNDDLLVILKKWQNTEYIHAETSQEIEFFENLKNVGYVVSCQEEEKILKEKSFSYVQGLYNENRKNQMGSLTFIPTYACNFACPLLL